VNVQIKISARHGHLSDETQQFLRAKAEKLLHFFNRLTSIEVTADLHNNSHKSVEIIAHSEHKHEFVASESSDDILTAMDLVIDKVEAQIRRYKEKLMDRRHTPSMGDVKEAPAETPREE
jgi:putative sigma-54 modulation protein